MTVSPTASSKDSRQKAWRLVLGVFGECEDTSPEAQRKPLLGPPRAEMPIRPIPGRSEMGRTLG